jgi:PAS domain S-box-containing protein
MGTGRDCCTGKTTEPCVGRVPHFSFVPLSIYAACFFSASASAALPSGADTLTAQYSTALATAIVALAAGIVLASLVYLGVRLYSFWNSRKEEQRFRELTDSLPQMVWTCDDQGNCDYMSRQWADYAGVPIERLLGLNWMQRVHPDDLAKMRKCWSTAIKTGTAYSAEYRLLRHDGIWHWFEGHGVLVRSSSGHTRRWCGLSTDIDEARRLREEMRRREMQLAKVAAAAPGAIIAYRRRPDGRGSFLYASVGIEEIIGLRPEDIEHDASPIYGLIHPEDVPRLRAALNAAMQDMTVWRYEHRVRHPRKGEIWVEARATPERESDGSILWYGFLTDITDRKRAEAALRNSEVRLRAALQSGGIGTWIVDLAKRTTWWDGATRTLMGAASEEPIELSLDESTRYVHPEDAPRVRDAFIASTTQGSDFFVEFRNPRSDGTMQWIQSRGVVERGSNDRPVRLIGASFDITARKHTEEVQLRSQKMEALGTLAGGIAHDFNNILLAITGNVRLAAADLPNEHPAWEPLAEIDKASRRATDLVRRILTFSRQQEARREVSQLPQIVDEALKLLRSTLPATIEIRTVFAAGLPPVAVDATQVHQILMNLGANAAYAIGDAAGIIDIRCEVAIHNREDSPVDAELRPGRYVRVTVSDNGCGMDQATRERIFDPFFTTKPSGTGTGLGLSTVHGIMKNHDGAITVYSEPGKGTTFHLYFPASTDAARPALPMSRTVPSGRGEHVLYIDDEKALTVLASRILQGLGYRVTTFTDPAAALAAFRAHAQDFDVVVTDLSMPGMNGFTLARNLLDIRPDLPIVMTSGYVRAEDQEIAQKIGLRDLILKPNTVEELGNTLDRIFRTTAAGAAAHAQRG